MALIEKNAVLIVGYDLIDRDHDEFIALINQLDSASNADFPVLFQQLHEHTEQHFDRENQLINDAICLSGGDRTQRRTSTCSRRIQAI
jgi:hemerythrin